MHSTAAPGLFLAAYLLLGDAGVHLKVHRNLAIDDGLGLCIREARRGANDREREARLKGGHVGRVHRLQAVVVVAPRSCVSGCVQHIHT